MLEYVRFLCVGVGKRKKLVVIGENYYKEMKKKM